MNRYLKLVCVVLSFLTFPSVAAAEFRRIEIKTLGMD